MICNKKNLEKIFLLVFPAVISLIFSSCGNENINSVANPTGTIIYHKDSVSVWLMPSIADSGRDTLYYSREDAGSLKIEFDMQSNADSTHARGYWGLYTNATPHFPIIPVILGTIDQHVIIDNLFFNAYNDTYFSFGLRFYVENSSIPYFATFKNINIIKK